MGIVHFIAGSGNADGVDRRVVRSLFLATRRRELFACQQLAGRRAQLRSSSSALQGSRADPVRRVRILSVLG